MALSYAILAALFNQPCSGYDLVKRFNKSVECFWSASHQQIYKALAKLEEDGHVFSEKIEQENRPNKKRYTVTEAGRLQLQQWIGEASGDVAPLKSDLLVKLSVGHMVPTETLVETLNAYYQQHRERLKSYQAVAKQYAQMPEPSRESQFQYLALRAGIRQQLAWVAWCEEAMTLLGQPVENPVSKQISKSSAPSKSQPVAQTVSQSSASAPSKASSSLPSQTSTSSAAPPTGHADQPVVARESSRASSSVN
ncbi:MAG: PadR family transcriptional regulator [Cyanobacteria bacterium J06632_3]